ncbi:MAG: 16S rRNA (guanine(966)-N(2))-methyltransferase RsmD [Wenzhouxiangella sp.]
MTGKIRIIGGRWRGRRLAVPADREGVRPTGDRTRETLFNWLQFRIVGADCLDLFAGTGALGLEAASRGASKVVLVERDGELVAGLRRAVEDWPGSGVLEIVQADALEWLRRPGERFDMVFVDPPFGQGLCPPALAGLVAGDRLNPGARVYVEQGVDEEEIDPGESFAVLRRKRQGRVILTLLEYAESPAL